MTEPFPTQKPRRRFPRRKPAAAAGRIPSEVRGLPSEVRGLPAEQGLQDEIAMLRAMIRLLRELAYEERPLPERLRIYDALGKLATRLGTLLKTERALDEGQDLTGTLSQALAEVIHELSQEGEDG
ncbi:MAG: hypothetical protein IMZ62_07785 [Chloroflexi bacterium]|nr:hypothetical protein [Chloroflexota bacterium]